MNFVKRSATAPPGFFACEAAGLKWLAEPEQVAVVEVQEVGPDRLTLERLTPAPPTRATAREFGAGLARLHSSGAPEFGFTPHEKSWFGPLNDPFEVPRGTSREFGGFWAGRLRFVTNLAAEEFDRAGFSTAPIGRVIEAVAAGAFNGVAGVGEEAPSRVHGDLWAGNVMWTKTGAVLIDPAAHGGHRLEDLAMLSLFGAPHLEEIFAGYEEQYPMPTNWREDLPAHYLFGLIAHVYLFGGGYAGQSIRAAEVTLSRAGA